MDDGNRSDASKTPVSEHRSGVYGLDSNAKMPPMPMMPPGMMPPGMAPGMHGMPGMPPMMGPGAVSMNLYLQNWMKMAAQNPSLNYQNLLLNQPPPPERKGERSNKRRSRSRSSRSRRKKHKSHHKKDKKHRRSRH